MKHSNSVSQMRWFNEVSLWQWLTPSQELHQAAGWSNKPLASSGSSATVLANRTLPSPRGLLLALVLSRVCPTHWSGTQTCATFCWQKASPPAASCSLPEQPPHAAVMDGSSWGLQPVLPTHQLTSSSPCLHTLCLKHDVCFPSPMYSCLNKLMGSHCTI